MFVTTSVVDRTLQGKAEDNSEYNDLDSTIMYNMISHDYNDTIQYRSVGMGTTN